MGASRYASKAQEGRVRLSYLPHAASRALLHPGPGPRAAHPDVRAVFRSPCVNIVLPLPCCAPCPLLHTVLRSPCVNIVLPLPCCAPCPLLHTVLPSPCRVCCPPLALPCTLSSAAHCPPLALP